MEEDYDYVELHVTNVRKVESDRRRCIVSMQPNNDVREFMFCIARFSGKIADDKHYSLERVDHQCPQRIRCDSKERNGYNRQGRDFPVYTCNVQLRYRYKRQYFRKCSRRGDDCA